MRCEYVENKSWQHLAGEEEYVMKESSHFKYLVNPSSLEEEEKEKGKSKSSNSESTADLRVSKFICVHHHWKPKRKRQIRLRRRTWDDRLCHPGYIKTPPYCSSRCLGASMYKDRQYIRKPG